MTTPEASSLPEFIEPLGKLYSKVVRARGDTAGGVGWSTQHVQDLRFHVLLSLLDDDPTNDSVTVCDFGCGWGGLWSKLIRRPAPKIQSYIGYDISDEMISLARKRVTDLRAKFLIYNGSLQRVDYAFISGTFNFHDCIPREHWETYVQSTLDKIASQCSRGLAFNLLHKRAQKKRSMFYTDPESWVKRAQGWLDARGGGEVSVKDTYLPDDFTIFVRFRKSQT